MKEILRKLLPEWGITPESDALERFEIYANMLSERGKEMNLIADLDTEEIAVRHFMDSLSLVRMGLKSNASAIDIGTGAGFPGVPVQIIRPDLKVTLLDSLGKRLDFLHEVKAKLKLEGMQIINARAEEAALDPGYRDCFDYVFSRAVARMNILTEICLPFATVGGIFCAMKSQHAEEEVYEAKGAIKFLGGKLLPFFDYTLPGRDMNLRIVCIAKQSQTPKGYPRRFAKIKQKPLV